jgi:hypothetical protein
MAPKDPFQDFTIHLVIDGVQRAGFSVVTLGETTTDDIDYREATAPARPRTHASLDGRTKCGNVTLKRGVIDRTP